MHVYKSNRKEGNYASIVHMPIFSIRDNKLHQRKFKCSTVNVSEKTLQKSDFLSCNSKLAFSEVFSRIMINPFYKEKHFLYLLISRNCLFFFL